MKTKFLNLEISNRTAIITISRPETLNALNTEFFTELNEKLDSIEGLEAVSVVIITGAGKAFVAGADIGELHNKTSQEALDFSQFGQATFERIENFTLPVIAAVNGYALGGGCELAMACDIRIASTNAKFGQPEVNLGLIPGFAGTQRLSRLVGTGNSLHLLLTGERISAEEAYRIGLVQLLAEPENILEAAKNMANTIISKGPKAVQLIKEVTRAGLIEGFEKGSKLESKRFSSLFENEGAEGMKAFLEKRDPNWKESH